MLVGVSGRGHRPQHQPSQIDLVSVGQAPVRERAVPGGRGQHRGAGVVGELDGAGHEIGVQVRIGRVRDGQPAAVRGRVQRRQVAGGVHGQRAAVAEITHRELRDRAEAGDVVVLDVRPVAEYAAGHIPGAVSIPVEELADRINELPEGTEIVVYCRGEYCVLAYDAVRLLTDRGRRAVRLNDGMLEWRLADMPVDTGDLA